MGINWGEIINADVDGSMRNLCNRVVENLPSHSAREHHFHEDARLFWAVASGKAPPPSSKELGTAAPHVYPLFLRHFDTWNDAGAPCPE